MAFADTFIDSEAKIKAVQKQAETEIKELHKSVLSESVKLFADIGWTEWSEQQLMADGQYKKISKALNDKMQLVNVDFQTKSGQVRGSSIYDVCGSNCTCKDFALNRLPCKHMYFLAMQLAGESVQTSFDDVESDVQSDTVDSSSEILGCCSLFRECSTAGHCIQTDAYYKQCAYRKNLEQGKIFYSKNASDFSQQKYDYIIDFRNSLGEQEKNAFDWAILYFRQTARGCFSCLCFADSVLGNVINKFEGFTLRSPISLVRRLFDDKILSAKTAAQLHAAYSKLPAPTMILYPPLSKDASQNDKAERDKKVNEIRAKNLKAWIEHFEKDQDLLQAISSKFMYFDFTDYHSELEEFYLDNRSSLSKQLPDIVVFNTTTAKAFKDAIEALG